MLKFENNLLYLYINMEETNMEDDRITRMASQIDKLFTTVCGDERMGLKGLVGEHREMKQDIDKLKAMRWYLVGAIAAIGFLLSIIK